MELGLLHASEFLAALVADHALRYLSILECRRFDGGVGLVVVTGDLVEGFVLIVLEPLEVVLYCEYWLALKVMP